MMAQGRVHRKQQGLAAGLLAACLVLGTAGFSSAAEEMEAAGPNTGKISLSGGVDFTNEYFFRGIYQGPGNDEGVIVQPYLDVNVEITDWMSVYFGTWNSLQTDTQGTGGGTDEVWYEADWYVGTSIALPANFSLAAGYTVLYGPSSAGIFSEEFNVSLAYDDSELWGDKLPGGVQPYVNVVIETDGASDGVEGEGVYVELGIEPSFTIVESEKTPITLSIPMTVGLSASDYYEFDANGDGDLDDAGDEDDTFGFFDIGVVASMPLSFIPSDYGAWSASAGVHFLFLGDSNEARDEFVGTIPGNGDDFHVLYTFGVGFEY